MFASRSSKSSLLARLSAMSCQTLFAITLLTQFGCQTRYERGQEAIAEQRFDDAKRDARIGKKEQPDDPRYDLLMAEALVKEAYAMTQKLAEAPNQPPLERKKVQRRYKDALPHAQAALDSGQLDAEAGRLLGKIHWELDNPIEAVKAWRIARADDPEVIRDADYLKALRTALGRVDFFKDHVQSLAFRTELAAFVEAHPSLIENLPPETVQSLDQNLSKESFRKNREAVAILYGESNRIDEALGLYSELSADFPGESRYHYERGSLLLRTGKEREAIQAYELYAEHPDANEHGERLRDVASRAETLGVRSVSLHFYQKSLEHLPDTPSLERAETILKLIEIYLSLADDALAREAIARYLTEVEALQGKVDANKYIIIYHKAWTHQRKEVAIEVLEQGIESSPPSLDLASRLAEAYSQQSQLGQAERVMKRYVDRVKETQPEKHTRALGEAADWSRRRQNYDLALFFYSRLLELDPQNPDILYKSAELYAQQGKRDEMRQRLEEYLATSKRETKAVNAASRLYRNQRMFPEAEELLKLLIKRDPGQLLYANNLAELYKDWGKVELIPRSYSAYLKARDRKPAELVAVAQRLRQYSYEDQAIPYLEEAADKGEPSALLTLADIYRFKRREAEMKRALERFISLSKDRTYALEQALSRYRSANLDVEAIATLEELLTLKPSSRENYQSTLSELYFEQGRQREAFDLWKDYVVNANDPSKALKSMFDQFRPYRRYDWLIEFYQNITEQGFEDSELYLYIGKTFHELGKDAAQRQDSSLAAQYNDKAREAYTLYLKRAGLRGSKLTRFARNMREIKFYEIEKKALEQYIADNADRRTITASTYETYARALFRLGDYDAATAALEKYIEQSSVKSSAYSTAADMLYEAGRRDLAEPYYLEVLDSPKNSSRQKAFESLIVIYYESGQRDKIAPLIDDFLGKSQNITSDRQVVFSKVSTYADRPMMLTQLERQMLSTDRSKSFEVGMIQWQMGDREEAERTWEQWLSESNTTDTIEALKQLQRFYAVQGELRTAADYAKRITTLAADKNLVQAHHNHALILASLGDFEASMEAHRASLDLSEKVDLYTTPEIIRAYASHLASLERDDLVRTVAANALKYPNIDQAPYQIILASKDLESGDVVRAERVIQQLKTSSTSLDQRINLLLQYNYTEQALAILENELISGDYVAASRLVIFHIAELMRTQGITQIVELLQPMLDRPRPDRNLETQLGLVLLDEGFIEQGATYLKVAHDYESVRGTSHGYITLPLTYAYLLLGETREAHRLLIDMMANAPDRVHTVYLNHTAFMYNLTGRTEEFIDLLAHLARDRRFAESTLPMLVVALCSKGDTLDAISTLRAISTPSKASDTAYLFALDESRAESGTAFLSGVAALGGQGYMIEALDLLITAPESIKELPEYHALYTRLQIALGKGSTDELLEIMRLARDVDTTAALIQSEASTSGKEMPIKEAQAQLELARQLMDAGRVQQASELASMHLTSPTHAHATHALDILLGAWFIDPSTSRPPRALVESYMDSSFNKKDAYREAIALLGKFGQDELAMELVLERADATPTADHIQSAVLFAALAGDAEAFENQLGRYHDISMDASQTQWIGRTLELLSRGHSYAFIKPMLDMAEQSNPQQVAYPIIRILSLIQAGDTEQARQVIAELLDRTNTSTAALERLLYELTWRKLSVEVARVIAPRLTEAQTSNLAHFYIGLAHADIHFDDEARTHLDHYLRSHSSEGLAAAQIAEQLLARERNDMALVYANIAVQKAPELPTSFYWRGIAHLIEGKDAEAREDLDRALSMGFGRIEALVHTIEVALDHDRVELARYYTTALVRSPYLANKNYYAQSPDVYARQALALWTDSAHARQGLEHLEATFPEIIANIALTPDLLVPMTSLYEKAGAPEQTFELYESDIQRIFVTTPYNSLGLPLNNLAYARSTSKIGLEEAEVLSRRSIAITPGMVLVQRDFDQTETSTGQRGNNPLTDNLAPGRVSSYLDTLGWIIYEQGSDLNQAERLITQSLYSLGSQETAIELYEHLAAIREAQDRHAEATWIRIHIESLRGSGNLQPPR